MRIIIDILHPAHVHFFRNFHAEMTERGWVMGTAQYLAPETAARRPQLN